MLRSLAVHNSLRPLATSLLCIGPHCAGGPCAAMEDEWVQCYHPTNQSVFEDSSIALSDLLLINAVPLWHSVDGGRSKTCTRRYSIQIPTIHNSVGALQHTHIKHKHTLEVFLCLHRFPQTKPRAYSRYKVPLSIIEHNVFGIVNAHLLHNVI